MKQKECIHFAGNDYLGLARDPALIKALHDGAKEYGISATSTRQALGWTNLHQQYEDALAKFTGLESACLLSSAYLGGAVYYSAMASRCKTVICDEFVHSKQSLSMRAAGLTVIKFKHLDMEDLGKKLKNQADPKNVIIASDSVYSISGEIAPIKDMSDLAKYYDTELFVDDAHGIGVYGKDGRGIVEYDNVFYPKLTLLADLGNALGTHGGFIAGRKEIVDACRANVITADAALLPLPIVNAGLKALTMVVSEPERRATIFAVADKMREILKRAGFETMARNSAILAIVCKDGAEAERLSAHFLKSGFRIPYFKYASEPRENLLRAVARSTYRDKDIKNFAKSVAAFKSKPVAGV